MKEIKLTKGKVAIVDDEDFERLNQGNWNFSSQGYAKRTIPFNIPSVMHWEVIGKPSKGLQVDHINGDKLDNRRENLRICTHSENQQNRRIHREGRLVGVMIRRHKNTTYYYAQRTINGRTRILGRGKTAKEANQIFLNSFK